MCGGMKKETELYKADKNISTNELPLDTKVLCF